MSKKLKYRSDYVFIGLPEHPRYKINRRGEIKARRGRFPHSRNNLWNKWRLLKPWKHKSGHLYINIDGEKKQVHRLVAEVFIPKNKKSYNEVLHKNGIPDDNRVKNLRWGNRSQNLLDNTRLGVGQNRERHYKAKLNSKSVKLIRSFRKRHPGKCGAVNFLARWFNVNSATISDCIYRRTWG